MIITPAEMRECLQEWYAQALTFEDLFEIHYTVRAEADKQAVFMSHELAKEECGGAGHEAD